MESSKSLSTIGQGERAPAAERQAMQARRAHCIGLEQQQRQQYPANNLAEPAWQPPE